MREYADIKETLETRKDRSAWDKGVTIYALELLEEYAERAAYEGRQAANTAEFKEWLKNGASDWDQYSWGGSSLIYNSDICFLPFNYLLYLLMLSAMICSSLSGSGGLHTSLLTLCNS